MTPGLALVVLAAAVALGLACAWIAVRRRAEREARRAARLAEIAARIDAAVSSIGEVGVSEPVEPLTAPTSGMTAPDVDDGLPGRLALLAAVDAEVHGAHAEGRRLSAAVVRSADAEVHGAHAEGRRLSAAVVRSADAEPRSLAAEAHAVAEVPVYAVGPRAVALVLPGLGRAEALGVLARIEARCASSGRAVELEAGEDAVELVARLLAQGSSGSVRQGAGT